MDRIALRDRQRAAVNRYARMIADDGTIPEALLDELAGIADQHAGQAVALARDAPAPRTRRTVRTIEGTGGLDAA